MWKFLTATSRSTLLAGALAGLIGLVVGFAYGPSVTVTAAGAIQETHPIAWDGHRWLGFTPAEKEAYLGGFLAGAAASQAYEALNADTAFNPEALADRIAELRSERALNFAFGANLYHVRLHDYYFYVDRRERPIYRAIAELNFQIQATNR